MAQVLAEILSECGLSAEESRDAVEIAIAKALAAAFRAKIIVRFDEDLEITAYPHGSGEPFHITLDTIRSDLRRHLLHQIEFEMQRRRTLNEAECLKELRGFTAPGEISRIAADGALFVSLEVSDYYRRLILNGLCPAQFQPIHERGRYIVGNVKEFYITSVVPVISRRRATKVRIMLSRTSWELPCLLLQERSKITGIRCLRRIPGAFSSLISPTRIPKEDIMYVGKELNEYLHVSIQEKSC